MKSGVWTRLRPAVAALAALLVLPLLAPVGAGAGGNAELALSTLELSTIDSINAVRAAHGLAPLEFSPELFGSALLQCRQMAAGGYFAHNDPGGPSFASRLAAFYPQGSHRFYSVGENLLWTLRPMSSETIVGKWMKSPEHRANLLNPSWRQVAVAAVSVPSAPGIFDDASVMVVTADFGVRR